MIQLETPQILIDRKSEREQIIRILDSAEHKHPFFAGLEFSGLAGSGMTRLLQEVAEECRQRQFPFIQLDCETGDGLSEGEQTELFLRQFVGQLGQHTSTAELSAAVGSLNQFRYALANSLQDLPLILLVENNQHARQGIIDWFRKVLVEPLLDDGLIRSIVLFMAGRSSQLVQSQWRARLGEQLQTFQLLPFDKEQTREHISKLPGLKGYSEATETIFAFSKGHPYTTESLASHLSELGVPSEKVTQHEGTLARHLYEAVIKQYILRDAPDWALPLLELAAVPRRFDPSLLSDLARGQDLDLGTRQSIQWFRIRVAQLRYPPLSLVDIEASIPAYHLKRPLREMLNAALLELRPQALAAMHSQARRYYSDILFQSPQVERNFASVVLELLYHTSQIVMIEQTWRERPNLNDTDVELALADRSVTTTAVSNYLSELLEEYNSRSAFLAEDVSDLGAMLERDEDLQATLGADGKASLIRLTKNIPSSEKVASASAQRSLAPANLRITRIGVNEFNIALTKYNQMVISSQNVFSSIRFRWDDWRSVRKEVGQAAFSLYLPVFTQDFLRRENGPIRIITDVSDIPWELLHDGTEYLCMSHPMTRTPLLMESPRVFPQLQAPFYALVIGNPTGDIPEAAREAEAVSAFLEKRGLFVETYIGNAASAQRLAIQLATRRYQMIHFAGHGYSDERNPASRGLALADTVFLAAEFARILTSQVLFLFNLFGGQHAESRTSHSNFGGELLNSLASTALLGGAKGCLGPMWSTDDNVRIEFALKFYDLILKGVSMGEAVMQTRQQIRRDFSDSEVWANWVAYGDPLAVLNTH